MGILSARKQTVIYSLLLQVIDKHFSANANPLSKLRFEAELNV